MKSAELLGDLTKHIDAFLDKNNINDLTQIVAMIELYKLRLVYDQLIYANSLQSIKKNASTTA